MKLIEITISSGVLAPEDVQKLVDSVPVPAGGTDGVVLSGRLPVWVYAALTHHFHPRPFVATFDPRLGGGVVVASHTANIRVGDVLDVSDADVVTVTFGDDGQ